jgi:tetrahydromethanopterin S-methyltransferase subunit F
MLVEQLIRETPEMQGFCIESVKKAGLELVVTLVPDLRYEVDLVPS